jgi:hypothetical protein
VETVVNMGNKPLRKVNTTDPIIFEITVADENEMHSAVVRIKLVFNDFIAESISAICRFNSMSPVAGSLMLVEIIAISHLLFATVLLLFDKSSSTTLFIEFIG